VAKKIINLSSEWTIISDSFNSLPEKSTIKIYTDSQNTIYGFQSITNNRLTTRKFCKLNNHLLWKAIQHTITFLDLNVTLQKVQAHTGDVHNDTVDTLAKEGAVSDINFTINHKSLNLAKYNLLWNNDLPLDRNIRKAVEKIEQFQRFDTIYRINNLKIYN
jgi:ribonuclease HI